MNPKCNICNREMIELGDGNANHHLHLLVTKSLIDGHTHTHGDLENKEAMKELLHSAELELGLEHKAGSTDHLPKEVVFKNRQRIGDMLMFTCGVRDFKKAFPNVRVNVVSIAGHIFDYNPYVDRTLIPTPENTVEIGPSKLTNKSNSLDWHFANAFRMSMEDKLKISIPQGESRPDIWLTQEEWDSPRLIEKPYWVICTNGEKGWGCKMYPHTKWQEVVDQNPDILFVQIGTAEDNAPRLKGSNVIDYVGKTQSRDNGIRDLFKLFLNAEGSIGLVSFHMHLSGGLYKPCVVVAGAREPVSFTRYAGHQYLSNDGCLPCAVKACWHCNIDACTNLIIREETIEKKIPKCADIIESEDVSRAIQAYYKGGRLKLNVPSEKPKQFKNIVPTPPKPIVSTVPKTEEKPLEVNTYGFTFGGGSLTERDWIFITDTIKKFKIKSVLEFGAGLSTLLFQDIGMKIVTYETKIGWIEKIKALNPKCDIRLWDGIMFNVIEEEKRVLFGMAFVDGPAGDLSRSVSTQVASMFADIVVVHDAGREWARKYQEQFLVPTFDGPFKGGHRCHLWVRKGIIPKEEVPKKEEAKTTGHDLKLSPTPKHELEIPEKPGCCHIQPTTKVRKFIKIVSTARGWGGCARSCTTIMKFLTDAGHRVQFIPFRNAIGSKEYQQMLATELKDVEVALGYGPIKEACDVMLIYADDFCWELGTPEIEEVFSEINANRTILMLNYRRGKIGEIPWTKNFSRYMFLCSKQEQELLKVYPEAVGKTKVLPPCTILEPFLAVQPNYEKGIRIVRHNSQGDTKFINASYPAEKCIVEIESVLNCRPDLSISMLPGPSFINSNERFIKVQRTADPQVIAEFLATGNLYWYSLPYGYSDMGPRTVVEALATGLPVLTDDWSGGAVDRITSECGWALKDKNWIPILQGLGSRTLEKMGKIAKERAFNDFRPEKWVEEIIGDV